MATWENFYNQTQQNLIRQRDQYAQTMLPTLQSLVNKRIFELEKQKEDTKKSKQLGVVAGALGLQDFTPLQDENGQMLPPEMQQIVLNQMKTEKDAVDALRGKYSEYWKPEFDKMSSKEIIPKLTQKVSEQSVNDWIAVNPDAAKLLPSGFDKMPIAQKQMAIKNVESQIARNTELSDFEKKLKIQHSFDKPTGGGAEQTTDTIKNMKAKANALQQQIRNGKTYSTTVKKGTTEIKKTYLVKAFNMPQIGGTVWSLVDGNTQYNFNGTSYFRRGANGLVKTNPPVAVRNALSMAYSDWNSATSTQGGGQPTGNLLDDLLGGGI